MFRVAVDPDPDVIVKDLSQKLVALLKKDQELTHASEVTVKFKSQSVTRRQPRFDRNTLVKIITAHDGNVCKACREMAALSPYRYQDARKQLPHHPGCRCKIVALTARDPGYLIQPSFKKVRRYIRYQVKQATKKKAPQRNATIAKMRKKGRKFLAPTGVRSVRLYQRKGK